MFAFNVQKWNLFAKALCGMCVVFMLIGLVFAVHRWDYLRTAISTQATITNLIERKDDEGKTLFAPVYVFNDQNGQPVKIISSTASFPPVGEVGDQIEVLYDPVNAENSIPNTFFSKWGFPAIFCGLGAFEFILFAAVAFFTGRYRRKNAEQRDYFAGGDGNGTQRT